MKTSFIRMNLKIDIYIILSLVSNTAKYENTFYIWKIYIDDNNSSVAIFLKYSKFDSIMFIYRVNASIRN